jgi:hypothetical protein
MSDERICLIDMDDTLYDYAGQLRRDLEALQSPSDPLLPEDLFSDPEPWLRRRIDVIRRQPGWWLNLPRLKLGWDIYEVAVQIGYTVEILSKGPFRNARAWAEKVERVQQDFGSEVAINLVGRTKCRTYGRVLVDDYPPYALDWLKFRPRGLVIMPAQPYNEGINHSNIIRYDGTNREQVTEAMTRAFSREPGVPLEV